MIVIPPTEITNSRLTDSSVTEDDYDEWDNATTYDADDYVIVISGDGTFYHNVYRSVADSNTGNKPWEDDVDNPVNWNLIGKTNRWKMFELDRNTQTTNTDEIEVEITPGIRVNTIALFGLEADTVQCVVVSGAETVYDETINLETRNTTSWYEYFFNPFIFQRAAFFEALPPFTDAVITITITRTGGLAKCAGAVVGNTIYLGSTEIKAESDSLNFSTVERDDFGNTTLVPRRTIPKTNQRVFAQKERVNRLVEVRADLNAVPAVWSGLDEPTDGYFNALFILGFYRKFRISLDHPNHAILDLELEEV